MPGWRIADDPDAIGKIRAYLDAIEDETIGVAAGIELGAHFDRLAENPRLGSAPTGPFESRPIYKFTLESGGGRRRAQVSYRVSDDGSVEILAFSCVRV
jgi:plasmid stabilization system protein ParE